MAEKFKAEHALQHPEYQYTPRKPSEKKRRKTKGKGDAIDSETVTDGAGSPQSPAIFGDGHWQSLGNGTEAIDLPIKHTSSDDTLAEALSSYNTNHRLAGALSGELVQVPTSHLSPSTQSIYEAAASKASLAEFETQIGSSHARWYEVSHVNASSHHNNPQHNH